MKISSLNFMYPNFTARNKNIRKADDIQRCCRRSFPALSSSYVDSFYSVMKDNGEPSPKRERAIDIYDKIAENIRLIREVSSIELYDNQKQFDYKKILKYVALLKTANCEECADVMLATLAANGYYNSDKYDIALDISFVNKKSGKSEKTVRHPLDHTFVVTTLDKKSDKDEDKIIMDSWLGFADSISGARARYKRIFLNNKRYKDIINNEKSMFRVEESDIKKKLINMDDYEMKAEMVMYPAKRHSFSDVYEMGEYCRNKYKKLVLNG